MIFDFVDGSTGTETAERLNRAAIQRVRMQPRVLVNVETCDLSKQLFGDTMSLPLGIAPMGMCNLTCPSADQIMATASADRNIPVCVSSASSTTLENMAELSGGDPDRRYATGRKTEARSEKWFSGSI